jgi:hypothetical protein
LRHFIVIIFVLIIEDWDSGSDDGDDCKVNARFVSRATKRALLEKLEE